MLRSQQQGNKREEARLKEDLRLVKEERMVLQASMAQGPQVHRFETEPLSPRVPTLCTLQIFHPPFLCPWPSPLLLLTVGAEDPLAAEITHERCPNMHNRV